MYETWVWMVAGVGLVVGVGLFCRAFARGLKFSDDFAAARRTKPPVD